MKNTVGTFKWEKLNELDISDITSKSMVLKSVTLKKSLYGTVKKESKE